MTTLQTATLVAQFQKECGDRAKYAVLYPIARNSRGQNLREYLEANGIGDWKAAISEAEKAGLLLTHGWRGRNGSTGFVVRLTQSGIEAISRKPAKTDRARKSPNAPANAPELTAVISLLERLLQEMKK